MKKNRNIIVFLVAILSTASVLAQSSKTAKADKLFDRFKFQEAIKVYKKLARADKKDRNYIYRKIGDAYSIISQPEDAEIWYEKAVQKSDIDPIYYYRYAMALRQNRRYNESIEWMRKYKIRSGMSDTRLQEFFKELDIVEKVKKEGFKSVLFNISLNSPYTEYGGTYFKDNTIVYTTNNINAKGKRMSSWDNMPFTDLKMAYVEGNDYNVTDVSDSNINTDFHESSPTFNSDFTVMFFTRNNLDPKKRKRVKDYNLKIYRSFYTDGHWSKSEEVHFDSNTYSCAHPSLSPDGKTLYFVSDMPGTFGKSDIYKVSVKPDWTLGEPENLGPKINTEGIETFPFISHDGNLFFSSDGHAGLGGLDIFVAFYNHGNFLMLKNLGLPYNSSKDDFALNMNKNNQEGYLSSNRLGGNGSDDIYFFKVKEMIQPLIYLSGSIKDMNGYIIPNADLTLLENDDKVEKKIASYNGNYSFFIDPEKHYTLKADKEGYYPAEVKFDTYNIDKPTIIKDLTLIQKKYVKNCVVDFETKKALDSVSVKFYNNNESFIKYTDKDGCFNYLIPKDWYNKTVNYEVEFRKGTYLPERIFFNKNINDDKAEYWLKPNKENVELIRLVLKPIYFDLDKSYIRPDAAAELDKLIALLLKYPGIHLSMESHTDSRGGDEYNQKLSQRRAQSTMKYLIDHGIDPGRLQARGFGETRPVNHCVNDVKCSKEEHQLNRRTEFMIVKK